MAQAFEDNVDTGVEAKRLGVFIGNSKPNE